MTDLISDPTPDAGERRPPPARALVLSEYGLIGDMRTAALIGTDGSIDWCCLPRFDSGSVFAAILDPERGGTWAIRPQGEWTSTQRYLPRTNILETSFRTEGGVLVLTDFMPVDEDGRPSGEHPEIHRKLRCSRGRVPMQMVFMPRFEYGARTTRLEVLRAGIFATDRTDQVLTLSSGKAFDWTLEQSTATTRFDLEKGEERWLVLRYDDDDIHPVDRYESAQKLDITAAFWARWSAGVRYRGPFRGMVKRSALLLKLLTPPIWTLPVRVLPPARMAGAPGVSSSSPAAATGSSSGPLSCCFAASSAGRKSSTSTCERAFIQAVNWSRRVGPIGRSAAGMCSG